MNSGRRSFVLLAWITLMIIALAIEPARAQQPVVQILLFYSRTCPHCERVLEEVIPPLQDKYGDGIELKMLDVGDPANRLLQLDLESKIGLPASRRGAVPAIFIGPSLDGHVQGVFLVGSDNIAQQLGSIIQQDLDAGGAPLPFPLDDILEKLRQLLTATPGPTLESETQKPLLTPTLTREPRPIHMAYFAEPGCPECARAKYDLNLLVYRHPQVKVTHFESGRDADLEEWLEEQTGVPPEKQGTTPAIFVGHHFLLGEEVNYPNLQALVERYQATGAPPLWEKRAAERGQAGARAVELFHSFDPTVILAAGLRDGLSPCAWATIIFFLICLALSGREGGAAVLIGGIFGAGASLTRLMVGLGLLKLLEATEALTLARRGVYGFVALLCFVQAGLALYNYIRVYRGCPQGMHLRFRWPIPLPLSAGVRALLLALAILALGFGISLPGISCTGQQIVLPTTILIIGMPELRVRAVLYLLFYSLAFILPLIGILCLAFLGTTSRQLRRFASCQEAAIKLLTAGLFLLLGAWLIMVV